MVKRKTITVYFSVLAIFLIVLTIGVYLQGQNDIRKEIVQYTTFQAKIISTVADAIAVEIAPAVASENIESFDAVIARTSRSMGIAFFSIYNKKGELLYEKGNKDLQNLTDVISEKQLREAFWKNNPSLYHQQVTREIYLGDLKFGKLVLAYNLLPLLQKRPFIIQSMINAAIRNIAFVVIVLLIIQFKFIGPINALSHTIENDVSQGNFSSSVDVRSNDEIGRLTYNFNMMMKVINERDQNILLHQSQLEEAVKKRTKELQASKEQAVRLSKAKSDFLAVMSHEIRTPLNGVLVMAELLFTEEEDEQKKKFIDIIIKSGRTLLMIINDILDSLKIDAGKVMLEKIDFNPILAIEDTINLFAERAFNKNLELVYFCNKSTIVSIRSDITRFSQVINNIVSNAIKFTEEGGVVVKSMVVNNGVDDELEITISDSGIGIPYAVQKEIFKPFTQAEQSINRNFGGTGLGLSICQKLTKAMGGRISLYSKKELGTTIKLNFPIENSIKPTKFENIELSYKIYVYTDHIITLEVLAKSLLQYGIKINVLDKDFNKSENNFRQDDIIICDVEYISYFESCKKSKIICLNSIGDLTVRKLIADKLIISNIQLPLAPSSIELFIKQIKADDFTLATYVNNDELSELTIFAGKNALVVDDVEINRDVMYESLKKLGMVCDFAENGQEAIDKFIDNKYDIVLMDCSMPILDGISATIEIRKIEDKRGGGHTPIIAVSANALSDTGYDWKGAGMNDYLTKPFTLALLIKMLSNFFEGKVVKKDNAKDNKQIIENLQKLTSEELLLNNTDNDADIDTDIEEEILQEYRFEDVVADTQSIDQEADKLAVQEQVIANLLAKNTQTKLKGEVISQVNKDIENKGKKVSKENVDECYQKIDLAVIEELSKIGTGWSFAVKLLKDFKNSSKSANDKLVSAVLVSTVKGENFNKIRSTAHAFKSICLSVGATSVANILSSIELSANNKQEVDLQKLEEIDKELILTLKDIVNIIASKEKMPSKDNNNNQKNKKSTEAQSGMQSEAQKA